MKAVAGNEPKARPGVYTITHIQTGRVYVGISKNVAKRIREHANGWGRQSGRLTTAVRECGAHEFLAEPVYYTISGFDGLASIEAKLIGALNSVAEGFNVIAASSGLGKYGPAFSETARKAKTTQEYRERIAAVNARPEVSARRSAALRKALSDPLVRAKMSASSLADTERSNRIKLAQAREEVKARRLATEALPETKVRRSQAIKAMHAVPENKAKHLASVRIANANPVRRAKIAASKVGRIWITNGKECRSIYPSAGIPDGWWPGLRCPRPVQHRQLELDVK